MRPAAAERLQKLKKAFIDQLPIQIKEIRDAIEAIDIRTRERLEDLHRRVHTLKGTAASFGLKKLSLEAEKSEHLAKAALKGNFCSYDEWSGPMKKNLDRLEREIACILLDIPEYPADLGLSLTSLPPAPEKEVTVYLCEDDPIQCTNLATQIECFGFRVRAFEDLEEFRKAACAEPPDVIVMDMVHHDLETGGADTVNQITEGLKKNIPVVFISAHSHLSARIAAVRAGANAYFVKPANPSVLCSTLHDLTAREEAEPYRIMIIDDDPYLSEMYSSILSEAGMETRTLNDPMQALPILSEFKPDLILMDMYMSGCNGMELARAIRQMEAYISIPIVFLSSETDIDMHFDARRMGGDEFLVKPIRPDHLISAVSVRAERMKLLRAFMVKDSMTGLYNHSTIKEYLSIHAERASRNDEDICFAMIDIDHFKSVNDSYGHPVGDQVLITLARLLKQRLRKTDIIGRYGGEEFAIILPGCSIKEVFPILEQLRKSFASICFTVGPKTFSSTFSCGVASLSSYPETDALCSAADGALYTAKHCGRNRVIIAPERQGQSTL